MRTHKGCGYIYTFNFAIFQSSLILNVIKIAQKSKQKKIL